MNFDEWHDHAAELAYAAHGDSLAFPWTHLPEAEREKWRGIARAVLAEGKIEVRPSAELAEEQTRDENERLKKVAAEWAQFATNWRSDAESMQRQLHALRESLANGEASDGYHSHNELYRYRMLYNAHTALAFDYAGWNVVRSRKHSDGEACFGGGWFVLHMETPAGQITNHYRDEHWHHFDGIAEAPTAPDWDGHTPEVAALRLEAAIEFLRRQFEQMRNHADLMKRAVARVRMEDQADVVRACTGCAGCEGCSQ